MKWGQIKTIFIVSFLILNIFLLQQLLDKINRTNYETLAQHESLEERLAADEITIGELPERGKKETYVSAKRYSFTLNDLESLTEQLNNQKIVLTNNSEIIIAKFVEPLEMDLEKNFNASIELIKSQVIFGDQYQLWHYYPNDQMILFFQEQNDHTVYFNESGLLAVMLNDEGDAIQYSQTILTDVTPQSEEQTVIDPINAIEVLYNNNNLIQKDQITEMKIGYHTLVPLDGGLQVFAPTWKIEVNGERNYFVNAMEAQLIPHDERDFVKKVKQYLVEEIELLIGSENE